MSDASEFALHAKAELLFPAHLISSLRELRGEDGGAVLGMGRAAELALQHLPRLSAVQALRDRLEAGLREIFSGARRNGGTVSANAPEYVD